MPANATSSSSLIHINYELADAYWQRIQAELNLCGIAALLFLLWALCVTGILCVLCSAVRSKNKASSSSLALTPAQVVARRPLLAASNAAAKRGRG